MDIREQIIKYREEAGSVSALSTKTDLYFLDKYGLSGKGSSYKYNGTLIPGNIYFFSYETDSQISDKVKFINRSPLIFYISSERVGQETIVKSIDLTITPPEQRAEIIQRIATKFNSLIDSGEKSIEKGGAPSEIRLSSSNLQTLLSGTGYNFSVKGFKIGFMKSIKWVDYSDWCKLPFLKYSFIQGTPINEIYSNYRSKLKE